MEANKIFYNFLNLTYPSLSKRFMKSKDGSKYETYDSIKDIGHKFIYDTTRNIITHLYNEVVYEGCEYGKKLATEIVRVEKTERGFQTIRI